MLSATLFALAQAAEDPRPSTTVQKMIVLILITFVLTVIATKIVAKAANVHDATFGKAFLATALKNVAGWGSLGFLMLSPHTNPIFALAFVFALVPILVYKMVFGSEWVQALVIWIAVFAID
jgi:hypothetical protein